MGLISKAFAITAWSSLGGTAGWYMLTRHSRVLPIPPADYIFNHTLYARYNPNNAPVTQDICVRQVPLSKIRAELLNLSSEDGKPSEDEGRLVTAFCQGVWGGLGYAYQRRFLEKKYRGPETASMLWTRDELKASQYPVGTQITDHFEVVARTPNSIIVRCGDSPRKLEVRDSDGLFEMTAEVKEAEQVVEFGLKSVFYNGLADKATEGQQGPMSPWIQWLHGQYDKLLMETALRGNVLKVR
ncbi:hypothetical protein LTR62_005430 [Meristemomyces frigidus]|uniref:Uncharacterized protein n=1 Tax=Meristemomyces frigidus TaxID=1508187 RepID=A0AAN7YFF4_9PEZI|nr:hypothetical protein LTR62_005430 [Meristemomyces frigidus]